MRWGDLKDKFTGLPDNTEVRVVVDGAERTDARTRVVVNEVTVDGVVTEQTREYRLIVGDDISAAAADAPRKRKKGAD